jgi:hypothetical protein
LSKSFLEAATAARHDLGKYMIFQLRWVGREGPLDDVREALESDLLRTRDGPGGTATAAAIWEELRDALAPFDPQAVASLDEGMALIAARLPGLADGTLETAEVRALAQLAWSLSEQLEALYRRAKEE